MKSLSVKQPWAWAIMHGKLVENRTWTTSHRGPIAIHAGKGWDRDGEESPLVQQAWQAAGKQLFKLDPSFGEIALGAVVAVAELAGVCSSPIGRDGQLMCDCGPWAAAGQWHWKLTDVRPLAEPVPCRGALGLWTLPDDVEAAVVAQLGERADV